MVFFKFTPSLNNWDDLEEISVSGDELVQDCVDGIKNAVRGKSTRQILLLGPPGIGKSHTLLRIFHNLSKSNQITPVRFAEEEYSISSLDDLCRRILKMLGFSYNAKDATTYCKSKLNELKKNGKPVVLFVENLQDIFEQIYSDLAKLRSIIQSDQSLCIVGSAFTYFDLISSPNEPFYRFFDTRYIQGLSEEQIFELIKKRLILEKKQFLIKPLYEHAGNIAGIRLLTGGNPRLVHILTDIMIQKNSVDDMEQNILSLLDILTPLYQAKMQNMSGEQRRLFDTIALSKGPLSPTEIAMRLHILQPASVVSQLRRLQRDGIVENVKFSNKKGTRYQITERLYRIWREMRSEQENGADKVKLFVDFIKLWHTQEKQVEKFVKDDHNNSEFDNLWFHSKKETTENICHVANTTTTCDNIKMHHLYATFMKLIQSNQFENAQQKIQQMMNNNREKNELLQKCGDVLISFAKLELYADSTTSQRYAEKLEFIINKLHKLKINIPENMHDRKTIHITFETIASFLISNGQHERAMYFNNVANDCSRGFFCAVVLNQRAEIKVFQKLYDESLMLVNDVLKQEPENQQALARKVYNLTVLNRQDLAIKTSRQLLALDVRYFVYASMPFVKFRCEQELLALVKQHHKALLELKSDRRANNLRHYVKILALLLLHSIIDKKTNDCKFAISVLSSIKDVIKPEDLTWGCAYAVFANTNGIDTLQEMFSILLKIFGPDKLEGLSPLARALEYLKDMDLAVLEKLHPETRHLVIIIIQKISPDVTFSQKILDSVSF